MTLFRQLLPLAALSVIGGCRLAEPEGDPNALVGRWATTGIEIEGRGSVTTMQTACERFTFSAPMVPAADGRFVIPAAGVPLSQSWGSPPTMLRGQLVGTTLTIDVHFVRPDTTFTNRWTLQKDANPRFETIACAA